MNEKKKTTSKNKPEHEIRSGDARALLWLSQANSGYRYYHFSLARCFTSMTSGKESHGSSFFANQEEDLVRVVRQASEWIRDKLDGAVPQKETNANGETS